MIQSNNRPFKNKPLSNIQQAQCLQYAFQIGMIRSNPADRVERPRKEKFKSEILKYFLEHNKASNQLKYCFESDSKISGVKT